MEQVKHNTAAGGSLKRYERPEIEVIEVKAQDVLCGSLDGTPSNISWTPGSDSDYGFGDEE